MKQSILLQICLLIFFMAGHAQKGATVFWGEELKINKIRTNPEVIHADNTGVYVQESYGVVRAFITVGDPTRESATLYRLDKTLSEVYRQDFDKALKGKEYERFFFLKDKLFLLATSYKKSERKLLLYAAEVNKIDGELSGEFQEVTSWQKDEKSDDIKFNINYNGDSSRMVIVSSMEGSGKNIYEVKEFDSKLKQVNQSIHLSNEFDPATFQMEDVIYTSSGNVVIVGRIYAFAEGQKKKEKYLQFQHYSVRVYDPKGVLISDINTDVSNKWIVSSKVVQAPGKELVLAAFYSNDKKAGEINGMLVQRIDPASGKIISTSMKEINLSLVTQVNDKEEEDDDDDDAELKREKRERKKMADLQDDSDGFSKYMRFRKFIFTPDNGLIILAEKYRKRWNYARRYSSAAGSNAQNLVEIFDMYECGEIMMSRIELNGDISWIHVLPKQQIEFIPSQKEMPHFGMGSDFLLNSSNRPFFSSFSVLTAGNAIVIVFNDHKKNGKVLQAGQPYKRALYFGESICYGVRLDPVTGKYTRQELFDNSDGPTAMPRLGATIGRDLYLVARQDRMLAKTKIAVAKVSVKN